MASLVLPSQLPSVTSNITNKTASCLYALERASIDYGIVIYIVNVPVMLTIAILGMVGNVLAYIVLSKEMKHSSTSFLLKSLAVTDISVLISNVLYHSLPGIYSYHGILVEYMKIYHLTKKYFIAVTWFCKTIAVYILVFVSVERYIAVCKPLKAASICTIKNTRISLTCLVIFSLLYNAPKVLYYDLVWKYDPCSQKMMPFAINSALLVNQFFIYIYIIGLYYLILFILPIGVMISSNVILIRTLRRGTFSSKNTTRRKQTDNLTTRTVLVVTVFIVMELPAFLINTLYTINLYAPFTNTERLLDIVQMSYIFGTINSFINFYLYCLIGSNFRRTAMRIFHCKSCTTHFVGSQKTALTPKSGQPNLDSKGKIESSNKSNFIEDNIAYIGTDL